MIARPVIVLEVLMFVSRLTVSLALAVCLGSVAVAQGPGAVQQFPVQKQMQIKTAMDGHYSQRLKARFNLQWMQIPGFSFWGARVVGMDPNSPLHQIGIQLGDVVTRLDGERVSKTKWWDQNQGIWRLPQLERHYGRTQVRNIRTGTTQVRNDYADLGPRWQVPSPFPGGGGGGGPIIVP